MPIAYRPATPADEAFVISSWSRAFKASRSSGMIATEDWAGVMHPQIRKAMARPDVRTIVACAAEDPSFLFGWICGDTSERVPVVFFAYVKEPYRRAGHGRGLLAELGVDPTSWFRYVCWTPVLQDIKSKIPLAKHDHNFGRYPKTTNEEKRWRP